MSKTYSQILYDVAGHIATITLHRPEKRNAFSGTMGEEIHDAFLRAVDDEDVRAIILTGSGDTFCVGIDLAVIEDDAERDMILNGNFLKYFATCNYHCSKPTICAMNGTSVGVGVGFNPPKFLKHGDRVRVAITGLGELDNPVETV